MLDAQRTLIGIYAAHRDRHEDDYGRIAVAVGPGALEDAIAALGLYRALVHELLAARHGGAWSEDDTAAWLARRLG